MPPQPPASKKLKPKASRVIQGGHWSTYDSYMTAAHLDGKPRTVIIAYFAEEETFPRPNVKELAVVAYFANERTGEKLNIGLPLNGAKRKAIAAACGNSMDGGPLPAY